MKHIVEHPHYYRVHQTVEREFDFVRILDFGVFPSLLSVATRFQTYKSSILQKPCTEYFTYYFICIYFTYSDSLSCPVTQVKGILHAEEFSGNVHASGPSDLCDMRQVAGDVWMWDFFGSRVKEGRIETYSCKISCDLGQTCQVTVWY